MAQSMGSNLKQLKTAVIRPIQGDYFKSATIGNSLIKQFYKKVQMGDLTSFLPNCKIMKSDL